MSINLRHRETSSIFGYPNLIARAASHMGNYSSNNDYDSFTQSVNKQPLQPSLFELKLQQRDEMRQLQSELGSKAQQTDVKVEKKLLKEARLKYQSFRIGQSEIRDLNKKKLLDLKNFKGK